MVVGYERSLPLDIDIAHPLACDGLLLQNDICGVPDDDTQLVSKSSERTQRFRAVFIILEQGQNKSSETITTAAENNSFAHFSVYSLQTQK